MFHLEPLRNIAIKKQLPLEAGERDVQSTRRPPRMDLEGRE